MSEAVINGSINTLSFDTFAGCTLTIAITIGMVRSPGETARGGLSLPSPQFPNAVN